MMIKIKYRKEWVGISVLLIIGGSIILFLLYQQPLNFHFNDNASYFEQPKLYGHTKEGYPWTIRAQHGKTQQGTDKVYFWGQVNMYQAPYNKQPETTIK